MGFGVSLPPGEHRCRWIHHKSSGLWLAVWQEIWYSCNPHRQSRMQCSPRWTPIPGRLWRHTVHLKKERKFDYLWYIMILQGLHVSTACVYWNLHALFCVKLSQDMQKSRYVLTFARQEFFEGFFPLKAFFQGWPEIDEARLDLTQNLKKNTVTINVKWIGSNI